MFNKSIIKLRFIFFLIIIDLKVIAHNEIAKKSLTKMLCIPTEFLDRLGTERSEDGIFDIISSC